MTCSEFSLFAVVGTEGINSEERAELKFERWDLLCEKARYQGI